MSEEKKNESSKNSKSPTRRGHREALAGKEANILLSPNKRLATKSTVAGAIRKSTTRRPNVHCGAWRVFACVPVRGYAWRLAAA